VLPCSIISIGTVRVLRSPLHDRVARSLCLACLRVDTLAPSYQVSSLIARNVITISRALLVDLLSHISLIVPALRFDSDVPLVLESVCTVPSDVDSLLFEVSGYNSDLRSEIIEYRIDYRGSYSSARSVSGGTIPIRALLNGSDLVVAVHSGSHLLFHHPQS